MNNNRSNMAKMGKYIAKLRKAKGYTQKELSELLDVSDKTISKWERGDIAPDITILRTLAKELDSTVDDILCGEENVSIDNQDESTTNMINIYSELTKKKMIKEMIIGLIVVVAGVLFVFYVENYYKWDVTRLKYDGDVTLRGYIFSNKAESKLIINKIMITNDGDSEYNKQNFVSYKILIKKNNKEIYLREKENINIDNLTKLFDDINIVVDNLSKVNKNELYIDIIIYNSNNDEYIYNLKF